MFLKSTILSAPFGSKNTSYVYVNQLTSSGDFNHNIHWQMADQQNMKEYPAEITYSYQGHERKQQIWYVENGINRFLPAELKVSQITSPSQLHEFERHFKIESYQYNALKPSQVRSKSGCQRYIYILMLVSMWQASFLVSN